MTIIIFIVDQTFYNSLQSAFDTLRYLWRESQNKSDNLKLSIVYLTDLNQSIDNYILVWCGTQGLFELVNDICYVFV